MIVLYKKILLTLAATFMMFSQFMDKAFPLTTPVTAGHQM